jgi:hypothetical protein
MTLPEINAAQQALDLLYNDLMSKGLLTPEIKVIFHNHYNRLTKLKQI